MRARLFAALATMGLAPAAVAAQAGGVGLDTLYGCVVCHAEMRDAFVRGVHAERGIVCVDCHGGDPRAVALPAAHRGRFTGAPSKVATVALCGSCHADPDRMRQHGLPTGQLAEFRTSRHGQLLLRRGDIDAPTCTDCHDAHTILRRDDARSNVYPVNIPETCAHCHEDRRLMGKYGLSTGQMREFRESAHGVALFRDQNFAAPTCVGCHGSHSALPPTVTEIANVCGRCHVLVEQALNAGPHGAAARAGRIPGCLACHSNHGTARLAVGEIVTACRQCHTAGSHADSVAATVAARAGGAADALRSAEDAIQRLEHAGRRVADTRFRYRAALTEYLEIGQLQHSLALDQLEDLERRVGSTARDIAAEADAVAERRWEHRLLLIPIWFLTLAIVFLARVRLRELRGRGGSA
jgi:hypothetical protein